MEPMLPIGTEKKFSQVFSIELRKKDFIVSAKKNIFFFFFLFLEGHSSDLYLCTKGL